MSLRHLLSRIRTGARKFAPPNGRAYELFDCSVLLLVLWLIGYVVSAPGPSSEAALRGPFLFMPQQAWGVVMTAIATTGIVCSFRPSWVTFGYMATIVGSMFWATLFFVSMFLQDVESARIFIVVVLYGWVARRLWREEDREWEPNCDSDKPII